MGKRYRPSRCMCAHDTSHPAQRRLAVGIAVVLVRQLPTSAADISVSGDCDLVEAIENANDTSTGRPNTDCVAGDPAGADTVNLTSDVSLMTAVSGYGGYYGLPPIRSEITVRGNGFTIARDSAEEFRIFSVFSSGDLTLKNTTVSNGGGPRFPRNGGSIRNSLYGTLTLIRSTVTGNSTPNGAGGIINSGAASLTNSSVSGNSAGLGPGQRGGGIYITGNHSEQSP